MRKETDLAKVKRTAHLFLDLDIQLTDYSPMVVSHPFTNSGIVGFRDDDGNISVGNLIENPADLTRWRQQVGEQIDQADNAYEVFLQISKPYYLAFLKYAAPALSEKDLGQMLSSAWILNEMPNQDPNISKGELVNLFHSVSPEYLMDAEEQQQYQELEDPVTIYRGVTSYNAKNIRALSWTLDRDTAEWFAHRFGEEGTVYEAQIQKSYILAFFGGRNESEVIVDPKHLEQIIEAPEPEMGMKMI